MGKYEKVIIHTSTFIHIRAEPCGLTQERGLGVLEILVKIEDPGIVG